MATQVSRGVVVVLIPPLCTQQEAWWNHGRLSSTVASCRRWMARCLWASHTIPRSSLLESWEPTGSREQSDQQVCLISYTVLVCAWLQKLTVRDEIASGGEGESRHELHIPSKYMPQSIVWGNFRRRWDEKQAWLLVCTYEVTPKEISDHAQPSSDCSLTVSLI
ncbi:hypothetical protein F4778DRAFT_337764 [Xylariomycetidae sp. FL2044]|nr:hypothetical protein F4778DRAFT_337764 [Xylariomycetidae sp. FL2044]